MNLRPWRWVSEGEKVGPGMGVAYRDIMRERLLLVPVPFNLVVSWLNTLWWKLAAGWFRTPATQIRLQDAERVRGRLGQALIELGDWRSTARLAMAKLAVAEKAKDGAYHERNQLVALLARLYPSALCKTEIDGWDPEWHWCVFLQTPEGQLSWHIHEREFEFFDHVRQADDVKWDGHTTEEKYERVARLVESAPDCIAVEKQTLPA